MRSLWNKADNKSSAKVVMKKLLRLLLKVFYIFPVKDRQICFLCYRGMQYSCNPKYIAEEITRQYGNEYTIIFFYASQKIKNDIPKEYKKCKFNSLAYIYYLMTSKYIVSNITIPDYLPYRKSQVKICTWHGTVFKRAENKYAYDYNIFSAVVSENQITTQVWRDEEGFDFQNEIWKMPSPRNDLLKTNDDDLKRAIKSKLGLNIQSKIVLYAPTYRERINADFLKGEYGRLKEKLIERFGGDWMILTRNHQLQKEKMESEDSHMDVSDYPDMQELLDVADVLITDYSSCMWDFTWTKRPCFLLMTDYEEYISKERQGDFYIPLTELPFPVAMNINDFYKNIMSFSYEKYRCDIDGYHKYCGAYKSDNKGSAMFINKMFYTG